MQFTQKQTIAYDGKPNQFTAYTQTFNNKI